MLNAAPKNAMCAKVRSKTTTAEPQQHSAHTTCCGTAHTGQQATQCTCSINTSLHSHAPSHCCSRHPKALLQPVLQAALQQQYRHAGHKVCQVEPQQYPGLLELGAELAQKRRYRRPWDLVGHLCRTTGIRSSQQGWVYCACGSFSVQAAAQCSLTAIRKK